MRKLGGVQRAMALTCTRLRTNAKCTARKPVYHRSIHLRGGGVFTMHSTIVSYHLLDHHDSTEWVTYYAGQILERQQGSTDDGVEESKDAGSFPTLHDDMATSGTDAPQSQAADDAQVPSLPTAPCLYSAGRYPTALETSEACSTRRQRNFTLLADLCADVVCVQGWDGALGTSFTDLPGFNMVTVRPFSAVRHSGTESTQIFVRRDMDAVWLVECTEDSLKTGTSLVIAAIPDAIVVNMNVRRMSDDAKSKRRRTALVHALATACRYAAAGSGGLPLPVVMTLAVDDPQWLDVQIIQQALTEYRMVRVSRPDMVTALAPSGPGNEARAPTTAVFVRAPTAPGPLSRAPAAGANKGRVSAADARAKLCYAAQKYVHVVPFGAPENPWSPDAMLGSPHVPVIIEPVAGIYGV